MCQSQTVCRLIGFCSIPFFFFYSQESGNGHLKGTWKISQCILLKVLSLNLQTLNNVTFVSLGVSKVFFFFFVERKKNNV